MSTILYLPSSTKGPAEAPIQQAEAKETSTYCSQTERIAHELKNCISVLLLAVTSLKDNADQPFIPVSHKRVLENIVHEMNRLVDEVVRVARRRESK